MPTFVQNHYTAYNGMGFKANTTHFPSFGNLNLVALTQWQYWWWFWFTFLLCLYLVFTVRLVYTRTLSFHPKITTSLRSHGRWGDMLICFIPIFWCVNILTNSHFLLRHLEWQTENSLFTLRVRGKQWYWVYKFDLGAHAAIEHCPVIVGKNKKVSITRPVPTQWSLLSDTAGSVYARRDRLDDPFSKVNTAAARAHNPNLYRLWQKAPKALMNMVRYIRANQFNTKIMQKSAPAAVMNPNSKHLGAGERLELWDYDGYITALINSFLFNLHPRTLPYARAYRTNGFYLPGRSLFDGQAPSSCRYVRTPGSFDFKESLQWLRLAKLRTILLYMAHDLTEAATEKHMSATARKVDLAVLKAEQRVRVSGVLIMAHGLLLRALTYPLRYPPLPTRGWALDKVHALHTPTITKAKSSFVGKSQWDHYRYLLALQQFFKDMGNHLDWLRQRDTVKKIHIRFLYALLERNARIPFDAFPRKLKKNPLIPVQKANIALRRSIDYLVFRPYHPRIKVVNVPYPLTPVTRTTVNIRVWSPYGLISADAKPHAQYNLPSVLRAFNTARVQLRQRAEGLAGFYLTPLLEFKKVGIDAVSIVKTATAVAESPVTRLFTPVAMVSDVSTTTTYEPLIALAMRKVAWANRTMWQQKTERHHANKVTRAYVQMLCDWFIRKKSWDAPVHPLPVAYASALIGRIFTHGVVEQPKAKEALLVGTWYSVLSTFIGTREPSIAKLAVLSNKQLQGVSELLYHPVRIRREFYTALHTRMTKLAKNFAIEYLMYLRRVQKGWGGMETRASTAAAFHLYLLICQHEARIVEARHSFIRGAYDLTCSHRTVNPINTPLDQLLIRGLTQAIRNKTGDMRLSPHLRSFIAVHRGRTTISTEQWTRRCERAASLSGNQIYRLYKTAVVQGVTGIKSYTHMALLRPLTITRQVWNPAIHKFIDDWAGVPEVWTGKNWRIGQPPAPIKMHRICVIYYWRTLGVVSAGLQRGVGDLVQERFKSAQLASLTSKLAFQGFTTWRARRFNAPVGHYRLRLVYSQMVGDQPSPLQLKSLSQWLITRPVTAPKTHAILATMQRHLGYLLPWGTRPAPKILTRSEVMALKRRWIAKLPIAIKHSAFPKPIRDEILRITVMRTARNKMREHIYGLVAPWRSNVSNSPVQYIRGYYRILRHRMERGLPAAALPLPCELEYSIRRPLIGRAVFEKLITGRAGAELFNAESAQSLPVWKVWSAVRLKLLCHKIARVHLFPTAKELQARRLEDSTINVLLRARSVAKEGKINVEARDALAKKQMASIYRHISCYVQARRLSGVDYLAAAALRLPRSKLTPFTTTTQFQPQPHSDRAPALNNASDISRAGYLLYLQGASCARGAVDGLAADTWDMRAEIFFRGAAGAFSLWLKNVFLGKKRELLPLKMRTTYLAVRDVFNQEHFVEPTEFSMWFFRELTSTRMLKLSWKRLQYFMEVQKQAFDAAPKKLAALRPKEVSVPGGAAWAYFYAGKDNQYAVNALKPITKNRWVKTQFEPTGLFKLYRSKRADVLNKKLLVLKISSPKTQLRDLNNNTHITFIQKKNEPVVFTSGLSKIKTEGLRVGQTVSRSVLPEDHTLVRLRGDKENNLTWRKKQAYRRELTENKRLLWVTKQIVLPIRAPITIVTNSYDVIHSWFIPGLGLKMDCVPGRSTHHTIFIDRPGYYYGQCAEVCGRRHHHMPIKILAVPFLHFVYWWNKKVRVRTEQELTTRLDQ